MIESKEIGALVLRLTLGVMYVAHALLKIVVYTPAGSVAFFVTQGFPGWSAYAVIAAELIGGVLLILGAQVRLVALALVPVLAGAVLVHLPNGWVFSAANGGWEYPAFLIAASVVQALIGEGAYALRWMPQWLRLASA